MSVDADNLAWLKEVVTEVGWPGRSMVGGDGAHAAWLLAQHADQDPSFQRRCLDLLSQAVVGGEASSAELAYLTDRVLSAEGKPQEYGTQFIGCERGWIPRQLRDPEGVDERRAQMGLERLADNNPPRALPDLQLVLYKVVERSDASLHSAGQETPHRVIHPWYVSCHSDFGAVGFQLLERGSTAHHHGTVEDHRSERSITLVLDNLHRSLDGSA
jgi:hypothetical protein